MVRATWHGATLADSDDTVVVEGNHYFPPESIRWDHFSPSDTHTTCPWKGEASYYTITVDGESNPDAAWCYPDPKPAALQVKDRVAFWRGVEVRTEPDDAARVVSASREIAAAAAKIFELIADPEQQPRWDGNTNLAQAAEGQRVRRVGDVFSMTLTGGQVRENHVAEFEEGRRIAWRPAEPGHEPPGHLWRWELEPVGPDRTRVTHTYDWAELTDPNRFRRARATTAERLAASLDRLAALAENS